MNLSDMNGYGVDPDECLKQFIRVFGGSLDPRLWVKLIEEEESELRDAVVPTADTNDPEVWAAALKELGDLVYVLHGFEVLMQRSLGLWSQIVQTDELCQWMQTYGAAVRYAEEVMPVFGPYSLAEAFRRIHNSNLSKLDDDGNPIIREDGKVMKGPNYEPPVLVDLV